MASVLYFGSDDRIPRIINDYYENLKKQGTISTLTLINEEKALQEALTAMSFDAIFIETSAFPTTSKEYLKKLKTLWPALKSNLILVGDITDPKEILKQVESGWHDYIVMPPDRPLLLEKLSVYTLGVRLSDKQVYSLKLGDPTHLAKSGIIEELSEFDCKIRTYFKIEVGELMIIYAKSLSADGETMSSALVRAYQTEPHSDSKEAFLTTFNFIGTTPDTLQHIRTALRKVYVSKKSS